MSVIARHVLAGRLADAAAVAVIARHVLAGRLADAVVSNLQRFEAPNCLPFLTSVCLFLLFRRSFSVGAE